MLTKIAFTPDDGGRHAAGFRGSTGDCVVRAIAIASELPYAYIYATLAAGNAAQRPSRYDTRKRGAGIRSCRAGICARRAWFKRQMQEWGFRWTPLRARLRHADLPAHGRLVIELDTHLCAVIDGVLRDTHDCSIFGTRRTYGYWQLVC